MSETTYWASSTPRRCDGVPINDATDAEYLSRRDEMYVFAVTA